MVQEAMRDYQTTLAYACEVYFMRDIPKEEFDSDFVTFISFIYEKDELRVLKDIKDYFKNRDKKGA